MCISGLIMYNAGKHQDFVAIELVNGHIVYVQNDFTIFFFKLNEYFIILKD